MKINNSGSQLTGDIITEVEKQLKIKLPKDYKDFMIKHNGGRPEEDWGFDFIETGSGDTTSSLICDFATISNEYNSLQNGYKNLVEAEEIPPGLLPIADDPGGNIIFLSVAEEDYGKVCFGNHELADPETGFLVMSLIADSFTEFIDKLYILEE